MVSAAACFAAPFAAAAQSCPVPDKYVLQWSDDFRGTVLDASKWNYRTDVKAFTAHTPANISLDGEGHMNIALRQEDFAGKHFTGGGIVSKADFRYGYYEVQARTTKYPGWHTAFWMLAGDGRTIPPRFPAVSNTSTEIDDFEIEDPAYISMGTLEWLHGQNVASTRADRHYVPGFSLADAYHTYGLEWTENEIGYYLDGKVICTQAYPSSQTPHDRLNIWLTSIGYKSGVVIGDKSVPADIGLAVAAEPSPASFGRVAYYVRDYYVRDTEPGYAEYGVGWVDGLLPGYSRLGSRSAGDPNAFAVWTPTILCAGQYRVEIYRAPAPRNDAAARVTVRSKDGVVTRAVDFQAGPEGWVDLGVYELTPGSGNSVTVENSGHGRTYADTVKFVRQ